MSLMRIHCFISCLCKVLEHDPSLDERPLYFCVWDAEFALNERWELSYHAGPGQTRFRHWYERLYGLPVIDWYDLARSREWNAERLDAMLRERKPTQNVLVMLDLYCLPERENKFNQNPFPHFVMLEATRDPEAWLMRDPDFRWEGTLAKARVLNAVTQPSVSGGFSIDATSARPPSAQAVRDCFLDNMKPDNALTRAVVQLVRAHVAGARPMEHLPHALRELPVLALRKYAYEHGLAYFYRALGLSEAEFLRWCDEVEKLVKTYSVVQYRALKCATLGAAELLDSVYSLLAEQDVRESRIKRHLCDLFRAWCNSNRFDCQRLEGAGGEQSWQVPA